MNDYLLVALGGALGSVTRFGLTSFVAARFDERPGSTLPWGTLLVNVSGSFLIGLILTLAEPGGRWIAAPAHRHFLVAGICGGYTTFSAFSVQTLRLAQNREWLLAGLNVVGSVVACLVAVWLGHLLALAFSPRR